MKVLALDTSTLMSTCAVIENGRLLGEYSLSRDMSHSERLVPMIEEILAELDIKIGEIDLYAVAKGPGSFTGLRIGVATVKSFAHVFNKPVVGISTLEALAYNMPYHSVVVPMLDARRDRVYSGIYTWQDGNIKCLEEDRAINIEDYLEELSTYDRVYINGDGADVYRDIIAEKLGHKAVFAKIGQNSCRAVALAELALEKYDKGQVDDFYSLVPEYLRMSQAERQKKQGEKNGSKN